MPGSQSVNKKNKNPLQVEVCEVIIIKNNLTHPLFGVEGLVLTSMKPRGGCIKYCTYCCIMLDLRSMCQASSIRCLLLGSGESRPWPNRLLWLSMLSDLLLRILAPELWRDLCCQKENKYSIKSALSIDLDSIPAEVVQNCQHIYSW